MQRRSLAQVFSEDPRVEKLIEVKEAFVPCLKLRFHGIDVDLTYANILPAVDSAAGGHGGSTSNRGQQSQKQPPATPQPQPESVEGWHSHPAKFLPGSLLDDLIGMLAERGSIGNDGVATLRSINGVLTSHWILHNVGPNVQNFQTALVCVKHWAKARGV